MRFHIATTTRPVRAVPLMPNANGFVAAEGGALLVLGGFGFRAGTRGSAPARIIGLCHHLRRDSISPRPIRTGSGGGPVHETGLACAPGVAPAEVRTSTAHGTGTFAGDLAETRAIQHALGEHAIGVPVSLPSP